MRLALVCLGLASGLVLGSCTESRDGVPAPDGGPDPLDCVPDNPDIHPGAYDFCDGIDQDCNSIVDDGPGVPNELVYRDDDGDGYGVLAGADPMGCEREGWVAASAQPELDCNDTDAAANPLAPERCDYDRDGALGATDCDDHDPMRAPGRAERCNGFDDDCDGAVDEADTTPPFDSEWLYVLDEDGDGYPTHSILACSPPGGGYVKASRVAETDCAPNDPNVHPNRADNCETRTDANCDGVFHAVYITESDWPRLDDAARAAFTASGPADPPSDVRTPSEWGEIFLCPGTYRVHLTLGHGGWHRVRGLGDSPDDVVLDGGGTGRVVAVPAWDGLETSAPASARFENLTITHGATTEAGGCLLQYQHGIGFGWGPSTLEFEDVVFRDCEASEGGAIASAATTSFDLRNTWFVDSHATVRGGAISHGDGGFTMTGGGFEDVSAPTGNAISAWVVSEYSPVSLTGVDFSDVPDDLAITFSPNVYPRVPRTESFDLGADASLHCTPAGCTP